MTYQKMTTLYRNKVRGYTKNQCDFAMRDIHKTIALHEGDLNHPYIQKLWAELDAVRERQHKLSIETLSSRWHTRSNGQPLDTEA